MKILKHTTALVYFIATITILASCDKAKPYDIAVAPSQARFLGNKVQIIRAIQNSIPEYEIEVGTTDVSSSDRTITYKLNPGSAVLGTHYSIEGGNYGTVTIPAKGAKASIMVKVLNPSFYYNFSNGTNTGRKDTLVFTLEEPSVTPAKFNDTVKLVITGKCTESDPQVNLDELLGDYTKTSDRLNPLPYTTKITDVLRLSSTSGIFTVANIANNQWKPIKFRIDWSSPSNKTITLDRQYNIAPSTALTSSTDYSGWFLYVDADSPGQAVFCDQKLTLNMALGLRSPDQSQTVPSSRPLEVVMER